MHLNDTHLTLAPQETSKNQKRIDDALKFLKEKTEKVRSFFHLPDTQYAAIPELA